MDDLFFPAIIIGCFIGICIGALVVVNFGEIECQKYNYAHWSVEGCYNTIGKEDVYYKVIPFKLK